MVAHELDAAIRAPAVSYLRLPDLDAPIHDLRTRFASRISRPRLAWVMLRTAHAHAIPDTK